MFSNIFFFFFFSSLQTKTISLLNGFDLKNDISQCFISFFQKALEGHARHSGRIICLARDTDDDRSRGATVKKNRHDKRFPQKGQRGEMSERLVEMNVRWQPNMKTPLRRLTASAGLQRRPIVGFPVLQEFVSRLRILRQRIG